jgi:ribosome-associated protein
MSLNLAKMAVKALDDKKGVDIRVIDISNISTIGDYFVVCTGTSTTHVKALADEVDYQLSQKGFDAECHKEGYGTASWILLDYKDIIVHIFCGETREFYNLEHLWADGEELDIKTLLEE